VKTVEFTVKEVQSMTKSPFHISASYYTATCSLHLRQTQVQSLSASTKVSLKCNEHVALHTAPSHQIWHGMVTRSLCHGWTCALLGLSMLGHKISRPAVDAWRHKS